MKLSRWIAATLLAGVMGHALAQEATIRKNLTERLPNIPKIDEVSKTPMAGLYDCLLYTSDAADD